jgi:hypothetical protein
MAGFGVQPLDETTWPDYTRIAGLGGGTVESYPESVEDRSVAAAFLHTGTVAMFEHHGFERTRQIRKNRWVVTKVVPCRLARPA